MSERARGENQPTRPRHPPDGPHPPPSVDGVVTIDREVLSRPQAESLAKKMFFAGLCLLPWLWVCNIWLFWPYFRKARRNEVIERYTRWSAIGFAVISPVVLTWLLTFSIGYNRFPEGFRNMLDASRLDLKKVGWSF